MKSQKIVILQFSSVTFEIHPGHENIGLFSLIMEHNDLRFEWKPMTPLQYIGNTFDSKKFSIIVRLCEISEIVNITESMSVVSLQFILRNSIKLPVFRFKNTHFTSITHLLEFLTFKHYVVPSKTSYNAFIGKCPYTRPFPIKDSISALSAVSYTAHQEIMRKFVLPDSKLNPLSAEAASNLFKYDGSLSLNIDQLLSRVYKNGLSMEARYKIWPYLLFIFKPHMTTEKKAKIIQNQVEEYKKLQDQYNSILKYQHENVLPLMNVTRTIAQDVNRTDRTLPQFKNQDSPYLKMVSNILTAYAIYNKDTEYVQGMGDLLSPLIIMSVKDWENNDLALMYDGTKRPRQEAEAIVFFMYAHFMDLMQQDRVFSDLAKNQEILLEKVFAIVEYFHKPLTTWMHSKELESLTFVFRHILLLFKREFDFDTILRIWECFLCQEKPYICPRFFLAAIIMEIFPKMLLETDGSMGEVMDAADRASKMLDAQKLIELSDLLREQIGFKVQHAVESLPKNVQLKDSIPSLKFMKIQ